MGVTLDFAAAVVAPDSNHAGAVDRAVAVLRDSQRRGGWGYNRNVACDADSTSWVVRLIATRDPEPALLKGLFTDYLAASGGVRTFRSPALFGSWADEHDEVAPMAGLALLALGDDATADIIRMHILSRHREHGRWLPFWWRSDAYVTAHNLTFLARSGGIPPQIAAAERERSSEFVDPVDSASGQESSFDTAQRLITAVHLRASGHAELLRQAVLAAQLPDGSWPASLGLLVPGQWDPSTQIFADNRRLLSTAMSVLALVDVAMAAQSLKSPGGEEI
ncbi:hypothetical protein AB0L63_25615 [Nocardia sp. NPDC051990]|uniref:hypothetical protein n=1 Tax=Nocardia sp. NPDC051990 TaxID=3155285 RepID=UPI00341A6CA9